MIRYTALRPLAAAFKAHPRPYPQPNISIRNFTHSVTGSTRPMVPIRLNRPTHIQDALFKTSTIQLVGINMTGDALKKEREEHRQQKLKADPEHVTTTSSVRKIFESSQTRKQVPNVSEEEGDMLKGIRADLKAVKEAFALDEVPPEVFWIGMAGLTPYIVTSISTLYLAWDMNYAREMGTGYLVDPQTAEALLHLLEPVQIGLGAIILSFLGAVHWGLEMAEYGGKHPYRRYTIGIIAPALAWPTILLPLDYAMLTQFIGFVGMYFMDAQACAMGWTPNWYSTYRFILTFVVGACIIMTLIGRGQIGDAITPAVGARRHLEEIRQVQREHVKREEEERSSRMGKDEKVKESKEQSQNEG
ncbi:hypothetical protein FN846DRAFT_939608 [Sphaerosporella brunnea]|uniref:Mitochondrial inner membrane protein 1 n=1 Tax=Sphaerosporella brunnea TaxID=1250544 RepID=A0A5J5F299_9PEZI|nr:hypothetical protein FN846DRAFT_939608 [Sphaerosporella brunnea]